MIETKETTAAAEPITASPTQTPTTAAPLEQRVVELAAQVTNLATKAAVAEVNTDLALHAAKRAGERLEEVKGYLTKVTAPRPWLGL